MLCPKCKTDNLIIQYEVRTLKYFVEIFDSLELAEGFFEDVKIYSPNLNWQLEEIKICNNCDYLKTKVLIKEEV